MTSTLTQLFLTGALLALAQALAALPWLYALDPEGFKSSARRPEGIGGFVAAVLILGVGLAGFMYYKNDPGQLEIAGWVYGSVLALQLSIDFIIGLLALLILIWPRGGT